MEVYSLPSYSVIRTLGQGGFAKVYLAIHNATGIKVAIKQISKLAHNEDGEQKDRIQREANFMKNINHPLIAAFFDQIESEEYFYIIEEFCPNGSVLDLINSYGPLCETLARKIFTELLIAVHYLHEECNIIHRDIKVENILFDHNGNVKLIDFGLSCKPDDVVNVKKNCGSPNYASPETVMGGDFTFKCDIWSLGVVLYVMVSGSLPFVDNTMAKLAQKIVYGEVDFPCFLSESLIDLLKRMLTKKSSDRIKISEIFRHPWLSASYDEISKNISEIRSCNTKAFNSLVLGALDMLGFNGDQVKKDVEDSIENSGTISFKILMKEKTNEALPFLDELIVYGNKKNKRYTSSNEDSLPPIDYKKVSKANRKSMPIKYKYGPLRKIPVPLIHVH